MSDKGILKVEGIQCDNHQCGFEKTDLEVNEYEGWVNKPCPICGDVILTEEDFNMFKLLSATTNIANKIPEETPLPTDIGKVYKPQSTSS